MEISLERRTSEDPQVLAAVQAYVAELYARAGYREVERYHDNPYAQAFFRKEL